jgi:hypothetical protein
MKKTRIVLTVDDTFSTDETKHLRYLISDALAEFRNGARRNPEEYVAKRYPTFSTGRQEDKVKEVEARRDLAERLHNAALLHTLEEIDVPDEG